MISAEQIRIWCLAMMDVEESPHFEKTSFRIKKKIFATIDKAGEQVCVKLSISDQSLFGLFDPTVVFPVPNKWGKLGWTFVVMDRIPEETMQDILKAAYEEVSHLRKASIAKK